MHKVSALYTMPTILNSLKPAANNGTGKAASTAAASSTTSSSTTSSASGLGSTFLNLLSQELQHQDPTAPMDSTAMVGQMISLNQLDQLININQTISGSSTAGTTTTGTTPGETPSSAAVVAANSSLASMFSPSSAAAGTSQTLPFDPSTMMPLNSGNSGAVAASINSSINAASMGLSGNTNNTSGGK